MRTRYLVALAALAVAAAAAPALARPTKVALVRIEGDTSGLGKAVAGALDDTDLEVVSGKPVARAIERLGLGKALGERDLAKLSDELEVDAVVKGVFDRRGHKLRFTIFTGGKNGKPFSLQVGDTESDRFRTLVRNTLVAQVAKLVPAEDEPVKGKKAKAKPEDVADEAPAKGKKAKARTELAEDEPVKGKKAKARTELAEDEPVKGKKAKAEVAEDEPVKGKKAKAKAEEVAAEDPAGGKKAKTRTEDVADDEPVKGKKAKVRTEAVEDEPVKGKKAKAEVAEDVAEDAPAKRKARPAATDPDAAGTGDAPPRAKTRVAAREDDDEPVTSVRSERARRSAAQPGINLAALRVDLGASMSGRNLRFASKAFDGAPRAYRNAPVLGGRAEVELYPLALVAPRSWLAGLGLAADYDRTASLTLRASGEMTVPLKITEQHYSFGVRYRLAFGHRPTSPTLTIGAGYGVRTFAVDRTGLMTPTSLDLPDVDYRMFDPGLMFRLPIGGRFALFAGGRGLLVTSAGAIQRADQYGAASVLGGSASAGFDVIVASHVAVHVAGEATQLSFTFAGTGALANSRDGDSSTVEVRGATDRYYGGAATLAVTY